MPTETNIRLFQDGGYLCGCHKGYELNPDGRTCSPVEACDPPCMGKAQCFRGRCICPTGFQGPRCDVDIDECAMPAYIHGCAHGCRNIYGSYECTCPPGYTQTPDKRACIVSILNSPIKSGLTFQNHATYHNLYSGQVLRVLLHSHEGVNKKN